MFSPRHVWHSPSTVIFPFIITQTWLHVTDYWLHLSLSGYQYKNTESFCVDTIPVPWVGIAFFFLDETCWLLIIWDHKIHRWHLLKLSPALPPGTSTQKTLFLSQPQQKHPSFLEWVITRRPPRVMIKAVPQQQWCGHEVQESVQGLQVCPKLCDYRSTLRHIVSPTSQSLSSVSTCISNILQLQASATLLVWLLIVASVHALVCVVAETRGL